MHREQVGVTTDLGADPTLVSTTSSTLRPEVLTGIQAHSNIPCPRCGNDECVNLLSEAFPS